MKLISLTASKFPNLTKVDDTYWRLKSNYQVIAITDEGNLHFNMSAGWVTDLRSGSRILDTVVPKYGNKAYDATILLHDMSYSGWVSKDVADELLYQGMILSGISKIRAKLAWQAVHTFGNGGYYSLDDAMPEPYTNNRSFEKFTWSLK
jgi:hypothetical protein